MGAPIVQYSENCTFAAKSRGYPSYGELKAR